MSATTIFIGANKKTASIDPSSARAAEKNSAALADEKQNAKADDKTEELNLTMVE